MTFRDKSADTTLDGANMSKEFDTWYLDFLKNKGRTPTFVEGFESRQPEIDALKAEVTHWKANHENTKKEEPKMGFVEALKIAERVFEQYKLDHPMWWKRMDGTPILNDLAVRMAVAYQESIVFDAAMKDFSTHQKEEECDS